jgi:light-regulated signal transduction histidine kinase (bacteriophytochrome)
VDYLVKPVVPEFVRSKVAVFVELAKKNELLRRQAKLLAESEQAAVKLAETRAELVRDLEHKNRELESFSYAVSHDLRAPLRRIDSFSRAVLESQGDRLDEAGQRFLSRVREASQHMSQLIDDVLYLSRVTRADLREQDVDLSGIVGLVLARLQETEPERKVDVKLRPGVVVTGDGQLLKIALENLLENSWKFTAKQPETRLEFGMTQVAGETTYFVRDNGAGFDMTYADRLFGPFQRLHPQGEFPGNGIGLATVQRIIHRHGGRVWAEGRVQPSTSRWGGPEPRTPSVSLPHWSAGISLRLAPLPRLYDSACRTRMWLCHRALACRFVADQLHGIWCYRGGL